jgi:phosphoadenosine phosphosulfate reductase
MQLDWNGKTKDEVAIDRLRQFCPSEGYYLAFSGGKDSTVLYDLTVRSGVKFDAHYHRTGVDPPELVQFIRNNYPTVEWTKPKMSLWNRLVEIDGLPSRLFRWCCDELKEGGGIGRQVLTGIRWQESTQRANRKMVEVCAKHPTKWFVSPIIDWSSAEIWTYIREHGLPYCSLYDEGFKRLGCVMCPMTSEAQSHREYDRWPKLGEAWHRATLRFYEKQKTAWPSLQKFRDGEHLWRWWLSRKAEPKVNDAQCVMFQ